MGRLKGISKKIAFSSATIDQPAKFLRKESPQVVGAEVGIAKDAGEGAATEFPVQGDAVRVFAPRLFQADMAAALTDDFPALLAQRLN